MPYPAKVIDVEAGRDHAIREPVSEAMGADLKSPVLVGAVTELVPGVRPKPARRGFLDLRPESP